MYKNHVSYLVCPKCKGVLSIKVKEEKDGHIYEGSLECKVCSKEYPIIKQIPRFVPQNNYADSFGFEWNVHKKTQHDDASGVEASKKRFYEETCWKPTNEPIVILEAGCGSGRFTSFALECAGGGLLLALITLVPLMQVRLATLQVSICFFCKRVFLNCP